MWTDYYSSEITSFSQRELKSIFNSLETPICLIGGWAVHFTVNSGFRRETSRTYIGSRDIDLGFHIEPDWNQQELKKSSVGRSMKRIKKLGFTESRFGFVKYFKREDRTQISEEEAKKLPLHEIFEVSVDILSDTTELDLFESEFGFRPPAEPLLRRVYKEEEKKHLNKLVSWSLPQKVYLPTPELLAAMKVRSIPGRDKDHKIVKDIADLHCLLWYVEDYKDIKEKVRNLVSFEDLNKMDEAVDQTNLEQAANLLGVNSQSILNSILNLLK